MKNQQFTLIWVCVDCMLHHANGECGSCHMDSEGTWDGHDAEPLQLIDCEITMGALPAYHSRGCSIETEGCDMGCEVQDFSWSMCHGCGSHLGGERHAMTLWWDAE